MLDHSQPLELDNIHGSPPKKPNSIQTHDPYGQAKIRKRIPSNKFEDLGGF